MRVLVDVKVFMQDNRLVVLLFRPGIFSGHCDNESRPLIPFIPAGVQAGIAVPGIIREVMAPVETVLEKNRRVSLPSVITIPFVEFPGSLFAFPDNPEFERAEVSPRPGGDFIPLPRKLYLASGNIAGGVKFCGPRGCLPPCVDLSRNLARALHEDNKDNDDLRNMFHADKCSSF